MIDTIKNKKNVRDKLIKSGGLAEGFNGASSPFTKKASKKLKKELENNVIHHRIDDDLVSKASILNNDVGQVRTYKQKSNKKIYKSIPSHLKHVFNSLNQLNAHSLNNFTG
jgi:predicted RND superfamily exporter protein